MANPTILGSFNPPTAAGGGGTTPTTGIWLGTRPQDPQDALTTYFPGVALEASWSEFDNDARQTVTIADGSASLVTSTGALGLYGLKALAPADDQFAITAQIRISNATLNFGIVAIFLGEDLVTSPTTATMFLYGPAQQVPDASYNASRWTDYNTYGAAVTNQPIFDPVSTSYIRLWCDRAATRVRPLWSIDGESWIQTTNEVTFGTAGLANVNSMGLVADNRTGVTSILRSSMIRIDRTTDPFLPCGGYI